MASYQFKGETVAPRFEPETDNWKLLEPHSEPVIERPAWRGAVKGADDGELERQPTRVQSYAGADAANRAASLDVCLPRSIPRPDDAAIGKDERVGGQRPVLDSA